MVNSTSSRNETENVQPAPEAGEKFSRLKALLREMFQLDRGDLDFGLYRIMNMKAKEITAFLDNDLLPQVKTHINLTSDEDRKALEAGIQNAVKQARELEIDPESSPKVKKLRDRLAEAKKDAHVEADVYNHLANFFARYYTEGDFLSLRRYSGGGESAYLIPYDGEEVKLHWANADQYYIKTTENYASYIFTVDEGATAKRVRFEIAAADNEKDNVKEARANQRRFVLAKGKNAVGVEGEELVVSFEHRPLTQSEKKVWPGNGNGQQNKINEETAEKILNSGALDPSWKNLLAAAAPTEANGERTVLEKHVERYTAKNSFDYFIHKDLKRFLRSELDLYLNTEVLNPDDLEQGNAANLDRALARVRAIRHIGKKIIDFLAQLENFQKQLWLKKKFVLESHWCVTLDRVPEDFYPEIAANEAQREEWVELFAINNIEGDLGNGGAGYAEPLSVEFLKANPFLVVDTRYFDKDFTDRLLEALSEGGSLDEQTDGLLIHGENFQALSLLQARYQEQIECVYIDPPYNSKTTAIAYKNMYKHSSWITLMDGRLNLSKQLSAPMGSHVVAIDENEQEVLGQLLSILFPEHTKVCVSVVHNKKGIQGAFFSYNHDYAFFCIPVALSATNGMSVPKEDWRFTNLRKWGRESERATARNCFYPILVKDNEIVGFGDVCPEDFHPREANIVEGDCTFVYPIDSQGIERKWRYARESVEEIRSLLRVKVVRSTGEIQVEKAQSEKSFKTVWDDPKYIAGDYGTRWLTNLNLKVDQDLYPKSIHTVMDSILAISNETSMVLDYFAGSGTTGHAVINLNREDGEHRKYILIEMADYFDTVLSPRIKKVVYSSDWKDGKPVSRKGCSQIFKYIRLESYEDTLDSLELTPLEDDLLAQNAELAEDYRLRYALGAETASSACLLGKRFTDPFSYTLSVVRDGSRREVSVDLPETFNYLIGLRMESRRRIDGVLAIAGVDASERKCLVLWRDSEKTDNASLDRWFEDNRKQFPESLDRIYVNGDHTLNAVRKRGEAWVAETTEPVFRELMFEGSNGE